MDRDEGDDQDSTGERDEGAADRWKEDADEDDDWFLSSNDGDDCDGNDEDKRWDEDDDQLLKIRRREKTQIFAENEEKLISIWLEFWLFITK